jgi:hypothetical protein
MALLTALADKEYSGVRLHIRAVHRRREALAEEAEGLKKAVTTAVGRDIDLDSTAATLMFFGRSFLLVSRRGGT